MWRSIVIGRITRNSRNADHVRDPHDLVPLVERCRRHAVEQLAERVADEAPLLVARLTRSRRCGSASAKKPLTPMSEERAEDERVLGLGLDADAVRALHVAAHDRPHDADQEHQAGEIAEERVGQVRAAVQELQVLGQLVVDLEHGGDAEQRQEPEVDHRVHQAGGRVAQQGAACTRRRGSRRRRRFDVLRRGAAAVGRAALPVAHTVGEGERTPHQHRRDDRVEGHLQRAGDALEHLARRARSRCASW